MSSQVVALRAADTEIETWKLLAAELGLSFNGWARRALNEQADLDRALLLEREATEEERT